MFWMLVALAALFYGISVVKLGDTLKKGRSIDRFSHRSQLTPHLIGAHLDSARTISHGHTT